MDFEWNEPPLTVEEQKLVAEYVKAGKPLDQLAYTREFEQIVRTICNRDDLETKRRIYNQLMTLRKRGRLPRIIRTKPAS